MSKFKELARRTGKKVGIGLSPSEKLQRKEEQEQDREDRYKRDLERTKRQGDVLAQQLRQEKLRAEMRVQSQRGRPKPMPMQRNPEGFGGELFGFGYGRRESEDFGFGRQPRQRKAVRRAPARRKKAKKFRRRAPRRYQQARQRYQPYDYFRI